MFKTLHWHLTSCILSLAVVLLMADVCSAQVEIRPENAPIFLRHKNKKDALGRRQGLWLFFNAFGEKMQEVEYVNGKREGMSRRFFRGEKLMEETEYLEARKEGDYRKYFISGNLQLEGTFLSGKKEAKWTKYFDDGSTKSEGYYKTGDLDGVWKFYTRKGKVTTEMYVNGVKKSSIKEKLPANSTKPAVPGSQPVQNQPPKGGVNGAVPQKQAENNGAKYIPTPNMPIVPKTNN